MRHRRLVAPIVPYPRWTRWSETRDPVPVQLVRGCTAAVVVTWPSHAAVLAVFVGLALTIVFVRPALTTFDSTMPASATSVTFGRSSLVLLSPIVTTLTITTATGTATRGYVTIIPIEPEAHRWLLVADLMNQII